mgnify:CR=1 FL=1
MADYSKFSDLQIQEILINYGVKDILAITPQDHGISNSNYSVQTLTGSKFLLKISNDKSQKQLSEELNILDALSNKEFSLSLTPLKNLHGKSIFQYEDSFGVIFPFIEATVKNISTKTISEMAMALAKLHTLEFSNSELAQIRHHTQVGHNFKSISAFLDHPQCPQDFKDAFQKIFHTQRITRINQSFIETIIHGDLYYDNCLFSNDHALKKIIDFEQAGVGSRILDIGISISGSCLRDDRIDSQLTSLFINHYQKHLVLTEQEYKSIDDFIHVGLFSIALWRIHRFLIGDLNPNKELSYQQLINRSINYEHSS